MDIHSNRRYQPSFAQGKNLGRICSASIRPAWTLRGIDLNSFDHFCESINDPNGERTDFLRFLSDESRRAHFLDEPSGSDSFDV